jgi:hypothetical protein
MTILRFCFCHNQGFFYEIIQIGPLTRIPINYHYMVIVLGGQQHFYNNATTSGDLGSA